MIVHNHGFFGVVYVQISELSLKILCKIRFLVYTAHKLRHNSHRVPCKIVLLTLVAPTGVTDLYLS